MIIAFCQAKSRKYPGKVSYYRYCHAICTSHTAGIISGRLKRISNVFENQKGWEWYYNLKVTPKFNKQDFQ